MKTANRLIFGYVVMVLLLAGCTWFGYDPANDPVKIAEASAITIKANNDADMAIARQNETFAQQREITAATARAVEVDAQTRARTVVISLVVGGALAAVVIVCVTVLLIFTISARIKAQRPVVMLSGHRRQSVLSRPSMSAPLTISDNCPMEVYRD